MWCIPIQSRNYARLALYDTVTIGIYLPICFCEGYPFSRHPIELLESFTTMAIHFLQIHNRSNHPQTFQCHGYHGNKDLTIKAKSHVKIAAPDGTSGAIIAVHEGQIGEQCEVTKSGSNGNDTIDISNICGAGGNMTCQQVGDPPGKFKGLENFMQACNKAYHKLSQDKKNQLKGHVFLDSKGNVKRIGAPKEFRPLEQFVRTFANGRTYIGVGAW